VREKLEVAGAYGNELTADDTTWPRAAAGAAGTIHGDRAGDGHAHEVRGAAAAAALAQFVEAMTASGFVAEGAGTSQGGRRDGRPAA